jgi:hypothetical protein
MRTPLLLAVSLSMLGACATTSARHDALSRVTASFVVDRPLPEVWPLAKEALADRHLLAFPAGEAYRLATAIVSPEGELPNAGPPSQAGGAAASEGGGRGRAGGGRAGAGGMRPGPRGSPRGTLVRYVVEGEALDGAHCQVRFTRYDRDSVDAPEAPGVRDAELEWAFIARAAPERAAALRSELADAGVVAP